MVAKAPLALAALAVGVLILVAGTRGGSGGSEDDARAAGAAASPDGSGGAGDPDAARTVARHERHGTFRVNGRRFFPIGLTMPPPLGARTPWGTDAFDELVDGGITVFRTGAHGVFWSDELLRETELLSERAARRGVYTWVGLNELAEAWPRTPDEERLLRVVRALRDHPATLMWKGSDEPWPRFTPADLLRPYRLLKQHDPDHLVHNTFGPFSRDGSMLQRRPDPPDLRPFGAVTDTYAVDVYPIYYHLLGVREPKLHMVGLWTKAIRRATGASAVTTTLQICFAGSDGPPGSGAYVLPTRRQERFMAYDAIINGARGLFFYGGQLGYCHGESDAQYGWNWTFWRTVLEDLVAEIGVGSPLHRVLLRPETTKELAVTSPRAQAIGRLVDGDLWILAALRGRRAEVVEIKGLPGWARAGRTYPDGRRVLAGAGRLRDRFPGWGVRVYRFTTAPSEAS